MRRLILGTSVAAALWHGASLGQAAGTDLRAPAGPVVATARPSATGPSPTSPTRQPPTGVPADWWGAVQQDLAQAEYRITWQERTALAGAAPSYHAPNRAQNFRTYFTETDVRLVPRTAHKDEAPAWTWGLALADWGRQGAAPTEAAAPERQVNGNRIEYRRAGLVEWYVNDARGLEQGFTIATRPEETAAAREAPVRLRLAVSGTLTGVLADDCRAVDFATAGGPRPIRFDHLHVEDARGRVLPAWFELVGAPAQREMLAIVVDDRDAVYPVTIDPLATSPNWTAESDQASAYFGVSAAAAGDVNGDGYSDVIVGAYLFDNGQSDEGRAFVYHGSASGLSLTPNWTAESNQVDAYLGWSVATAGDVNGDGFSDVIVGAIYFDNGQTDEGRAFVYHGSASGLSLASNWTAESDQVSTAFGISVASAGDVNGDGFSDVIIGAQYFNNGQLGEGRAFVYHGSAGGLSLSTNWTAESDQESAYLGRSVATAGDVNGDGYGDVIVGAYLFDNGQSDEGRAFVYHGSAAGLSLTPNWTAESDQASTEFGRSVATAGDTNGDGYSDVIVGAPLFDNGQPLEGRAFVYHGSAAGLSPTANWTTESDQAGAQFGYSVATAGDVNGDGYSDAIVGAFSSANGQSDEGRAFVYHGSAAGLSLNIAWTAESDQAEAYFGWSVATAGDVNGDGFSDVIVGARSFDNGQADEGRAFVYHGSAGGLSLASGWTAESDQTSAEFGYSVATAGDVNGDGFGDVIVGARFFDNGNTNEGRAFVYHGSASGLSPGFAWTAESDQSGAQFGFSVATAGDVNGDGFSDVIVGALLFDNGEADEGRAFVYHGSASGLSPTPAWTAESDQPSANFGGYTVATAGDVNGDGFGDVIVGARNFDNGQTDEGRAFVYHGSPSGLSLAPAWTAESDQTNARLGQVVASAGDVNGDGFGDVIVGAPYFDAGQTDEGRAFVYHGSAGGLSLTPVWTAESDQTSAFFTWSVATAGDVNGDGFSDVVVGAFFYTNGQSAEGGAFVYHGSASGLSLAPAWTAESDQADASFGTSVATAGDVNGDGFSDVIVGAPGFDFGQASEGRAFVYHGSASGLSLTAAWTAESDQASARFGASVATAGDVNGDGFSDVIVGAYQFDNGLTDEGRAFVYYGNGGPGRGTRPRQRRVVGLPPIAPLGRSDSETQFVINAAPPSVFGRTRLKLEAEVKPLGQSFDGQSTFTSVFIDNLSGNLTFIYTVDGLTRGTAYHWRVRAKYDLVRTPFQRNGPWIHVPINGWNEADLRTAGTHSVTSIEPAAGGNTGPLTATVHGSGLPQGATVRLTRSGQPDIEGSAVTVSSDTKSLTATFDLAGAQPGLWNVVATTPDAQTATLANAFTVETVLAPQLRVSVLGPARQGADLVVRRDRRTAYDVVIENPGNVDALYVPLWLAGIPTDATVELGFALSYPAQEGGEPDWSTVPVFFTSAAGKYVPLVIPRVPPGTTSRRVYITVPGPTHPPFTLSAAVTPPWVDGNTFRSCIAAGGITNPSCMGTQLDAINAYLDANSQLLALSGIALWAKVAWNCEPGSATLPAALAKAEQVLDYLEGPVEGGSVAAQCDGVLTTWWRDVLSVSVVGAIDPNDKLGAQGTLPGTHAVPYTIRFENLSTATADAQVVIVEDVLDHTKLDLATLSLEAITFGNVTLSPTPGQSSYSNEVPLGGGLWVRVAASLDAFTHRLTWYFTTVDASGLAPQSNAGFLPPNVTPPEGEGSVLFTVQPLPGLPNGSSISNAASITFDDPPAVITPSWLNTLDNLPPASRVKPFTAPQDPGRYVVQWEPVGSWPDLRDYTIYAREDAGPYWAWRINTVALSDTFKARAGHSYSFYSQARDLVGNVEAAPTGPDAQYTSTVGVGDGTAPVLTLAGAWPNPALGELRVTFSLASAEAASLELYDVAGRRVVRRAVEMLGPGPHTLTLARDRELRAGLYFVRLSQSGRVLHARVALTR